MLYCVVRAIEIIRCRKTLEKTGRVRGSIVEWLEEEERKRERERSGDSRNFS